MSPTSPRNLAASTGPTPNSWTRLVLAWATAALMRTSTAAIRCSRWRTSATSSVASCQRVNRRRTSGRDRGQQHRGPLGGEIAPGAAWNQVDQQPMQPVDGLGAGGNQILPSLGQQVQHRCLVLDPDPAQLSSTAGGD